MSTQTIAPVEGTRTVSVQEDSFAALVALAEAFPGLPAPYVTVQTTNGCRIDLQLNSAGEFEVWRTALGIDPREVTLHRYGGSVWLQADGAFSGALVQLTGHNIDLTGDQFDAPHAVSA